MAPSVQVKAKRTEVDSGGSEHSTGAQVTTVMAEWLLFIFLGFHFLVFE
jgi:hypothetical protein